MAVNSTKEDEALRESLKVDIMKRLLGNLLDYKKQITFIIVLILVNVAVGIVNPLLIQRAIDVEIINKNMRGLIVIVAFICGLQIANMAASRIWRKRMAVISNDIVAEMRRKLYIHIQTLGLDFFDSRPAGKILARVTGDINNLKDVLNSTVTQLIPELVSVVAVLIVMLVVSPVLTLSAAASLPAIIIGVYFSEIIAHKRWQALRKKDSNISAFIHENLAGVDIVQSFTAEKEEIREFSGLISDHQEAFRQAVLIADLFSPAIEVAAAVGTVLLYFLAIRVLHIEAAGIGEITAFSIYLSMFWGPIRNLANYYNKLITNLSSAERIYEIMDTEPGLKDEDNAAAMSIEQGEVNFENVSFAYPDEPDRYILKDVSFTARPGQTIALVGPTGAGKTTIVSLISRFYDACGGKVTIDGQDVKNVKYRSLRSSMGIMTQDNYLFKGTIRENIRYGRLDATDAEVEEAAKAVSAHEFISRLENGYDTVLQERGGGLSNGERQLIALARTCLADPKLLILDEATSAIDTKTELMVQKGIDAILKNRTAFVVAHRLSTIRNADCIMVIDQGGIVEKGTHDELMAKEGGHYLQLQSQM